MKNMATYHFMYPAERITERKKKQEKKDRLLQFFSRIKVICTYFMAIKPPSEVEIFVVTFRQHNTRVCD